MPSYKAQFSYHYYQFVHFHSERVFVAESLEQAEEMAKAYAEGFTVDTPFLRRMVELDPEGRAKVNA